MGVTLRTSAGRTLEVDTWAWGVVHHRVALARLFPRDLWLPARFSGSTRLEPRDVAALREFLEKRLLARFGPGQRMLFDGTITDEPDDGVYHRDEHEAWKNYTLRFPVLRGIVAFLGEAYGAVTVG